MMRVSQRLDYALRALTLLAQQPPGTSVAAGELAGRLGLPQRFVEQQITALARADIVASRRGAGGGCALSRPAAEISVRDVVDVIEGSVLDVPHTSGSAVAEMWQTAADRLGDTLGEITLADLSTRQRELDETAADVYYI